MNRYHNDLDNTLSRGTSSSQLKRSLAADERVDEGTTTRRAGRYLVSQEA
jgi:hypothetical protein